MLKYLFTASFKDGSVYCQKENDISEQDPTKSSFYDILQIQKNDNPVEVFCLADGVNDYLVDLRDGSFQVKGVKLWMHNLDHKYRNLRLIYFRRRTLLFNPGFESKGEETVYHLGWQGNDLNNNNVEYVIQFS